MNNTQKFQSHFAFKPASLGDPLPVGEAYWRVPKGKEMHPFARMSRNVGGLRSTTTVGGDLHDPDAEEKHDFYVLDKEETFNLRVGLRWTDSDIFIYKGEQYEPADPYQGYDLIVYPNGHVMEDFDDDEDDVENNVTLRYYSKRAEQEPEHKVKLKQAAQGFVDAIADAIGGGE